MSNVLLPSQHVIKTRQKQLLMFIEFFSLVKKYLVVSVKICCQFHMCNLIRKVNVKRKLGACSRLPGISGSRVLKHITVCLSNESL